MAPGFPTAVGRIRRTGPRSGQGCLLVNWKPTASPLPSGFSWVQWHLSVHCLWPLMGLTSGAQVSLTWKNSYSCAEVTLLKSAAALSRLGRSVSLRHFQVWAWRLKAWHLASNLVEGALRRCWRGLCHISTEGIGLTYRVYAVVKKQKQKPKKKKKPKPKSKQNPVSWATAWINQNYRTVATLETVHFTV